MFFLFKECLDAGLEEHKIKTRKAVFVLASSRIASRDVVIPHVKENRIRTLLYANSAEYFPVDLEKYQLSYRLLDEVEEEGEQKYKLMVLAVPNEMIDAYKSLAKVCLLTLVDLDYIGNAATQLFRKNIKNDLYAMVRLEEDTTMITIVRENKIELQRTFPYGIADVVQAVQNPDILVKILISMRHSKRCGKKCPELRRGRDSRGYHRRFPCHYRKRFACDEFYSSIMPVRRWRISFSMVPVQISVEWSSICLMS